MNNKFQPGIHEGVPLEDYLHATTLAGAPYVSGSTLLAGRPPKTPAHMKAHLDGTAKEESSGFALGTLCHEVLEGAEIEDHYAVMPDVNFATNVGKDQIWEEMKKHFRARHPENDIDFPRPASTKKQDWLDAFTQFTGKLPVSQSEWDKARLMTDAIKNDDRAVKLFSFPDGKREVSCFWTDPVTGIAYRVRPDYMSVAGNILADIKTTKAVGKEAFEWEINNWGYHTKAVLYRRAVAALTDTLEHDWQVWFVVLEKTPPYLAKAWRLDVQALAYGAQQFNDLSQTFARCQASGIWPGYPEDVWEIGLPDKVLDKLAMED